MKEAKRGFQEDEVQGVGVQKGLQNLVHINSRLKLGTNTPTISRKNCIRMKNEKNAVKLTSHPFRGSPFLYPGKIRNWCQRQHPEDLFWFQNVLPLLLSTWPNQI